MFLTPFVAFAALAVTAWTEVVGASDEVNSKLEPWQECSFFIAPSSSGGLGVFAAHDFLEDEIVEIAPFFLPAHHENPFIINSALQDYIYGYLRESPNQSPHVLSATVWGMTMLYNHHSESPNLKCQTGEQNEMPNLGQAGLDSTQETLERGAEIPLTIGVSDWGT